MKQKKNPSTPFLAEQPHYDAAASVNNHLSHSQPPDSSSLALSSSIFFHTLVAMGMSGSH